MSYIHNLYMAVLLGVASSVLCPIMAQTIAYSYDTGEGVVSSFGTSKIENYDVAVRLTDPALVGMSISSVSVPLTSNGVANVSVWLSKELSLQLVDEKKVNVPDIVSVSTTSADGCATVTFDSPYTITEEGVYVGYSFEVTELNDDTKTPVLLTSVPSTDGFYLHSSRQYRSWDNLSQEGSSCMIINLLGAPANSVAISGPEKVDAGLGSLTPVTLTLTNYGYNGIKSVFGYLLGIDEVNPGFLFDFSDNPVPAQYGVTREVEVMLPSPSEAGVYPIELVFETVNDSKNANTDYKVAMTMNVVSELVPHRAVVEEYTGFWCGWCPSGAVALEMMSERYPDDFIALAYHNSDSLAVSNEYPSPVSSFPAAYIDRASAQLDPYLGSNTLTYDFGLEKEWVARTRIATPADVNVSAELSEDGTTVDMSTSISFIEASADCRVEFVLVADSLHSPNWVQVNYFHNNDDYAESEGMADLVAGDEHLWDVIYNDVVVASSRFNGTDALIKGAIFADTSLQFDYSFDTDKIQNIYGKGIRLDRTNLRVVALLIGSNGEILNANKAKVNSDAYQAGVNDIVVDSNTDGEYEYYDIYGRRLNHPQNGMNIIKSPDGTTQKVIIR